MHKKVVLILASSIFFAPSAYAQYATGLLPLSSDEQQKIHYAPSTVLSSTSSANLTKWLPPVKSQGRQGSCVGWTTGYYLKSFHENREDQLTPQEIVLESNQYSPSYIFNHVGLKDPNDAWICDTGSYTKDALNFLTSVGNVTWQEYPYIQSNCLPPSNGSLNQLAQKGRIGSWRTIRGRSLSEVKSQLQSGRPVALEIKVYPSFQAGYDGSPYTNFPNEPIDGYHAILAVGYDDSTQSVDLVNSWGTGWGNQGFGKLSYSAWNRIVENAYVAYDFVDRKSNNIESAVVWSDDSDGNDYYQIKGRGFESSGRQSFADTTLNTIPDGQQITPRIDMNSSGIFNVVWADDKDKNGFYQVKARGFQANGSERFSDRTINTIADGQQTYPEIAMMSDGRSMVVWQDDKDNNKVHNILASIIDSSGNKILEDFRVHSNYKGEQRQPDVDANADGLFVVVWEDDTGSDGSYQIKASGFDENGAELFNSITINKVADGQQFKPRVSVDPKGNFIVVWQDDKDNNGSFQIYAAGFDKAGKRVFDDITVNQVSAGQQLKPRVSSDNEGNFVVVWEDDKDKNKTYQIFAAKFNSQGGRVLNDFTVNVEARGQQRNPDVGVLNEGSFIVTWQDDQNRNGLYQILSRSFNLDGSERYPTIPVNQIPSGQQILPFVAVKK